MEVFYLALLALASVLGFFALLAPYYVYRIYRSAVACERTAARCEAHLYLLVRAADSAFGHGLPVRRADGVPVAETAGQPAGRPLR